MKIASEFAYEIELLKAALETTVEPETVETVKKTRCTAWVGSGLSKVSCESGRQFLEKWAGTPGRMFTPYDYCSANISQYLPILVSYSGRNLDIQSAARAIVSAGLREAVLLVGNEETIVGEYLRENRVKVHKMVLPAHQEKKSFVAVLATWAMTGLALAFARSVADSAFRADFDDEVVNQAYDFAVTESAKIAGNFGQITNWRTRKWIVLGGGAQTPALLAWESMFSEGALFSPIVSDLKDYTHGRYLSALCEKQAGFVLLIDRNNLDLCKILKERFSRFFPVVEIRSTSGQFPDFLTHLLTVAFVARQMAESIGQSIVTPPKPEAINYWRNWGTIKPS